MQSALALAKGASDAGEIPIGAVLVKDGEIIGRGQNRTLRDCDPTAHAEIVALRDAAKLMANHRLVDTQLYVTIEPCTMCAGALIHARVSELYFGAREPRAGSVVSSSRVLDNRSLNHRVKIVEGTCRDECSALMREFFRQKRTAQKTPIR